jgi:acetyltransferase
MPVQNLDRIFQPHRIVVIGVTDKSCDLGLAVFNNLLSATFQGVVYAIDPKHEAIQGIPTYPDLASLPKTPDLALICSPSDAVPGIVQECGDAGIRGVLILSGGFRESGAAGQLLQQQIAEVARQFDHLRIIGPNSLGVIAPRFGLNASHAVTLPRAGHLAFVSQSRALCNALIDWAVEAGIGFSYFVSIGAMVDVGYGDLIDYFSKDPDTRAIILYLESIEHTRSFMSAARAFARIKPIVAYKAGRYAESAEAAASHTGAMVAEDAVYDAAFERAGVVRVAELDDVFDVAELLASKRLPQGPRLAIVSNAGGPAIIATDALLARGGVLAPLGPDTIARLNSALPPVGTHTNPIDLLDSAPPQRFAHATQIVLEDQNVDAALVIFAAQAASDPLATAKVVADVAEQSRKPILAAWMGGDRVRVGIQLLNEAGMATHTTPEQAVRAFMHLVSYSRNLETLYETPRDIPVHYQIDRKELRKELGPLLKEQSGLLTEEQAQAFLQAYQIPMPESAIARSSEEAVAAAKRIGYPVAIKVLSSEIVHKFDVGGVTLDVENAQAVKNAYKAVLRSAQAKKQDAEISGVVVQKMKDTQHAVEIILGAKKDPTFGAVIMVGSGGIATAVLHDRAVGLPPLNERLARRMLESLRIWPVLQGYRGRPAVNLDQLIEVILRFSSLIIDYPEIREFDINPLLVTSDEVMALDATVILDSEAAQEAQVPYRHLAIRPYPEEYIRKLTLKDGSSVTLRSVKPEDEPLWHELIASSSPESIHFRFRSFFHKTTHQMAIQHCVIDYEREMAIVAETRIQGERILVGVAHMLADANHESAEFAVIVPDAWHGKGVGGRLLDYCLELSRRWGIRRVVAETHPGNQAMLALFRKRGFASDVCYEDGAVYLEKTLICDPEKAYRQ